jgi:5'-nucleotidase
VGLVLVDQDGTIADFELALLRAFRAKHPDAPFIDIADRREVSARKQYGPEWGAAVDAIMKTEGFYLSLPVITGVPRAFDEMLKAGHEVFVCTAPLSGTRWCIPEKLAWGRLAPGTRAIPLTPDDGSGRPLSLAVAAVSSGGGCL